MSNKQEAGDRQFGLLDLYWNHCDSFDDLHHLLRLHCSLVRSREDLEKVRIHWLGKKGIVKQLFAALKVARG